MYTLISGSPKINKSNSIYFLNYICNNLGNYNIFELKKDTYEKITESIVNYDVIILAFPLYVDSPTSITLSFLDYIYDNNINIKNKKMYVIINCGFREGEQNISALNVIKRWCEKVGVIYQGSLLIGAGEVVGKKEYSFISRNVTKRLDYFSNIINSKEYCGEIITSIDFVNNTLYCLVANFNWNRICKKNKVSKQDLKTK